ncbi:MAG: hypothetical protein GX921_08730 [Bacteroidales bacterium]|nr:hypothetical protein [Bacteroidales bacterium]
MKKVSVIDFTSLKKTALIALLSIIFLSLSSCAAIIDSLLGISTCIEPGCDRDARKNASYCIIHSDKEHVEVDVSNPYKLHKPPADIDIKIKRKNY